MRLTGEIEPQLKERIVGLYFSMRGVVDAGDGDDATSSRENFHMYGRPTEN